MYERGYPNRLWIAVKRRTVGQKTYGGNQCPNIMPPPLNESRTVHNRHEPASSANAPRLNQIKMGLH